MDIVQIKDIVSIAGVIISLVALFVSVGILFQMRKDTMLAREDGELRIRPIVFAQNVQLDINKQDEISKLIITVVNAGLGPALNVKVQLTEDLTLPGTGSVISKDVFGESSILQVLPNPNANIPPPQDLYQ